jgi:hypothetical protein
MDNKKTEREVQNVEAKSEVKSDTKVVTGQAEAKSPEAKQPEAKSEKPEPRSERIEARPAKELNHDMVRDHAARLIKTAYLGIEGNIEIARKIRDKLSNEDPSWFLAGLVIDSNTQILPVIGFVYSSLTGKVPPSKEAEKAAKKFDTLQEEDILNFMKEALAE